MRLDVISNRNRMVIGIVTKVTDKGFGFIRSNDLGKDVFFHSSACVLGLVFDEIVEGMEVEFDVKETDKGLVAMGVSAASMSA